ncbi:hypothetical protein [Burkholderia gladioli]|uniref:hypothetical protein n=1 Tax=Burkholderia gladioli TaxID=28095 RepID=UPI00163DED14|nr:hypothetical protein [Burkholderia gladioli]
MMEDTQAELPAFGIWKWCVLLFALEPIAAELAHAYVRRHPTVPISWSTLRQLELQALDRLDGFPTQDSELLALVRSAMVMMCLPTTDKPVTLDSDHFVPIVAAEIWRAYRRLKDARQASGFSTSR